ncbi:KTSC domain-containing protein [Mesorhizobium sp.]|uniref:KTSC domain-containing protein n=1 Tax=Mesorhizobium sp. TaxID=1871066 RepID=UPI00257E69D0|nr:KTSC domain-containing protein [Mesorhizobium sp.]
MPSTSIRKTEYDPETRVLSVWFVASGTRYDYEAVPPETYAAFRKRLRKGPVLQRPLSRPLPAPPDCRSIASVACTRKLMRRFRSLTRRLALIPGSPCGVGKSTAGPGRPST